MILSRREQRLLREIDAALSASDPRLASMLAIFTRLTANEPLPRRAAHHVTRWARVTAAMALAVMAALLAYGAVSAGRVGSTVTFPATCVAVLQPCHGHGRAPAARP